MLVHAQDSEEPGSWQTAEGLLGASQGHHTCTFRQQEGSRCTGCEASGCSRACCCGAPKPDLGIALWVCLQSQSLT